MSDPVAILDAQPRFPGSADGADARVAAWSTVAAGWALVLLADRIKRGGLDVWTIVIVGAAAVVLIRPRGVWPLLFLAAGQLGFAASKFSGGLMVHWAIPAFFHGVLLFGAARLAVRRRSLRLSPADLFSSVEIGGAVLAGAGMFFAGLAKVNYDFLDPELSCGAIYYRWMAESPLLMWLPTTPWAQKAALAATLAGELVGGALVALRRTRTLGLLLLWPILIGLSLNPRSHYFEFAGLFFVLSLFFVAPTNLFEARARLRRWLRGLARRVGLPPLGAWGTRAGAGLLVVAVATLAFGSYIGMSRGQLLEVTRAIIVAAAALLLVAIAAAAMARRRALTRGFALRGAHLVALPAMLLFFANEISPYVGLRHMPTMTMAANLRLHPADNNHVLFDPLPTFSWSRDVRVIRSENPLLSPGHHMPWVVLVDRAAQHPEAPFTIEVDGRIEEVGKPGGDTRFKSRSFVARALRLGTYRPQDTPKYCDKPPPGMSREAWRERAEQIIRDRQARR